MVVIVCCFDNLLLWNLSYGWRMFGYNVKREDNLKC